MTSYAAAFNLQYVATADEHLSTTLIVEFLLKEGAVYMPLYGVPARVWAETFNTPE